MKKRVDTIKKTFKSSRVSFQDTYYYRDDREDDSEYAYYYHTGLFR